VRAFILKEERKERQFFAFYHRPCLQKIVPQERTPSRCGSTGFEKGRHLNTLTLALLKPICSYETPLTVRKAVLFFL
jgi:hypothetical protein